MYEHHGADDNATPVTGVCVCEHHGADDNATPVTGVCVCPHHGADDNATPVTGVKGQEERQVCLQRAEEAGLDVAAITKTVVENIRYRDTAVVDMDTSTAINVAISEVLQETLTGKPGVLC